jgi:Concanavalin A-like lectin/glucanases superfamily
MTRLPAVLAVMAGALALPAAAQATTYDEAVLADGPLTYLRLGEAPGATLAHDASPFHRDGTPAGAVTFGAAGPFSDAGTAVRLGKTGSLTADVPAASGSVELWVNPDRPSKNTQPRIVAHGDPAGDGWSLGIGTKRKLVWRSGSAVIATKITLGTGVWTALTVTWDGQKVRFYRNGVLAKSLNSSTVPASSRGDLVVGGDAFSGAIDEAAVYSQVLGAATVGGHFGAARVPVNTALPTIGGTAAVGNTLTVTAGTWTGTPGAPAYQWQRCDGAGEVCSDVTGATGSTFALADGAECSTFQVVETRANQYGSVSAVSDITGVVGPCNPATDDPAPLNEVAPTIDGTPAVGSTLTVQGGVWSFAQGQPAYRWQRCESAGAGCADVTGATATTYVPVAGDACATFRVVETVSNATGTDRATSDATGVVAPCGTDPGTGGGATTTPGGGAATTTPGSGGAATITDRAETTTPAGCLKLVAGRRTAKVRRLGTLRLRVAANGCLTGPVGASFKVRKGVRLRGVHYRLDGKKLKRAKGPKYVARVALAAGTHTLTVRVKPRAGKAKSTKLRLRLAVA